MSQRRIRTLLFSTLYPSSVRPGHGIFVETRLRELLVSGEIETKVVAPVPWFFSSHPRFGEYARLSSTPERETYQGIDVRHPRYLLPPMIGMNVAPMLLAMGAAPTIRRILDEGFDFDAIDAHYYYPDGVAAALLAKYFKKPFVITARGSDINLISCFRVPRALIRWAASRAHASIGVSTALTNAMAQLGAPGETLVTLRNGVDLTRFTAIPMHHAREALGLPSAALLVSVGNLVRNKGHHIAIEALVGLPAFRLVIVGEGPERRALESLSCRLGLQSRVTFAGRIPQDRLAYYYSAADILVLPSSREGWPNVLLESMACGTPVIANNVGGVSEIVTTDFVGRLLTTHSSAALVAAVQDLWTHYPDRLAVRAYAERYSWQSTTRAQVEMFERIQRNTWRDSHA